MSLRAEQMAELCDELDGASADVREYVESTARVQSDGRVTLRVDDDMDPQLYESLRDQFGSERPIGYMSEYECWDVGIVSEDCRDDD